MVLIECLLNAHRQEGEGEPMHNKTSNILHSLPLTTLLTRSAPAAQSTECAHQLNCTFDILQHWGGWGLCWKEFTDL